MKDSKRKNCLMKGALFVSRIKHTPEEKVLIAKAVLSGESSQAELARQYNTSEGRIREWVVKYKANGICGLKYHLSVKIFGIVFYT